MSLKYLSQLFDRTLTREIYADKLYAKISKHLCVFKRVKAWMDVSTMIQYALILPLCDYCNMVIDNCNDNVVSRLQHLQNRGGHIILKCNRFSNMADIPRLFFYFHNDMHM